MKSYLLRSTDRYMDFMDRWSYRLGIVAVILALVVIVIPAIMRIGVDR